jgi:hypothetical protein
MKKTIKNTPKNIEKSRTNKRLSRAIAYALGTSAAVCSIAVANLTEISRFTCCCPGIGS